MALQTYQINTTTDNVNFSQPITSISDSLHPYLTHISAMALFNKKGSNKIVRIKNVGIEIINSSFSNTSLPYYMTLQKISAYTGGTAVSAVSLDSTNSSLPSQVVCVSQPASVTTTNGAFANVPVVNINNLQNALPQMCSFQNRHNVFGSSFVTKWMDSATAQTQKITLREGQGIAFWNRDSAAFFNQAYRTEIVVRDTVSGDCYFYSDETKWALTPPIALFNGSGSGVVLEVLSVNITEEGVDNVNGFGVSVPAYLTIDAIENASIDNGAGVALTANPMDSSNSSLTDIVAYKNCKVMWAGSKMGAVYVRNTFFPFLNQFSQNAPNISNLPVQVFGRYKTGITQPDRSMDILLREGQGISIQQRNFYQCTNHQLQITFTVQDVMPAEADVESGVTYGYEGDNLEGTLVGGGGDEVYFGVTSV